MFIVIWRYNSKSQWIADRFLHSTESDASAEINKMAMYDVGGRREYRIAGVGEASTWHDPYAEQEAGQ